MRSAEKSDIEDGLVVGSGNYLKDRGYANPDEARTKFLLANEIAVAMERLGLDRRVTAERLGMRQLDISRIVDGTLEEFSIWRLLKALNDLRVS